MPQPEYTSLLINSQQYNRLELHARATLILSNQGLPDWIKNIWSFIDSWIDAEKDFIEVSTSGSTGAPKVIRHSKEKMINSARMTANYFNLQPGKHALLCMSPKYIGGMMMIVRSFVSGLNLVSVKPSGNPLQHIQEDQEVDFAAMVPMQVYQILFESDEATVEKLKRIGTLLIGGGEISYRLEQALIEHGINAYGSYGMTETVSHVALRQVSGSSASSVLKMAEYEALHDVGISVDDRGCLIIDAPHLSDEEIVTNDLVELVDDRHFRWLGRADHVINTGGIKIIPEVLEQKIAPVMEGRYFFTSIKDEKFGEALILIVESEDFPTHASYSLARQLQRILERHEMPKKVLTTAKFAETASGKIDRIKTMATVGD